MYKINSWTEFSEVKHTHLYRYIFNGSDKEEKADRRQVLLRKTKMVNYRTLWTRLFSYFLLETTRRTEKPPRSIYSILCEVWYWKKYKILDKIIIKKVKILNGFKVRFLLVLQFPCVWEYVFDFVYVCVSSWVINTHIFLYILNSFLHVHI